ncbi:MAG: GGDEF domain-containing protein [Spirochaetes bacterium]|nr:GGDEF domain-containing protein [Spirochaetota bacterium]
MESDKTGEPQRQKRARDLADVFDLDNIRVMVSLLRHESQSNLITDVVDLLHRMNLQYTQVVEKMELLRDNMNIDLRTGLLRYQDSLFENLLKSVSRILSASPSPVEGYTLSYIRLDIDDFSRFNNLWGHEIGDTTLHLVGECLRSTVRPTDLAIRYGGEELDAILPSTPSSGALVFLERLFEKFSRLRIDTGAHFEPVTLSAGVTTLDLARDELTHLKPGQIAALRRRVQQEADDALYDAKAGGKARWCVYEPSRAGEYPQVRARYQKMRQDRGATP